MKKFFLLNVLLLAGFANYAQNTDLQTVATAGNYYANSSASIDWTLGEIAIQTFENQQTILTQGFQQTLLSEIKTNIESVINAIEFSIYPNPASDFINIQQSNDCRTPYHLTLYSFLGNVVKTEKINQVNHRLDVSGLKQGVYLIRISVKNNNQIFKITKTN